MKVLLVGIDSKMPNLALMKLSSWYKSKGAEVGFDVVDPDLVYVSVILSWNVPKALGLETMFPNAKVFVGGPGLGVQNHLPPALILDNPKPDYDLYPSTTSLGYTTRGCIRNCGFCFVPKLEGNLKIVSHPSEIHDDRFKSCVLLDNNLLAAPREHTLSVLNWFIDQGVGLDMTQGFDPRLLAEEHAGLLKTIKMPNGIHLAWDNVSDEPKILRSIKYLKEAGFNLKRNVSFYVLVGYNSTFQEDVYRCNRLRDLGVHAFVMKFNKRSDPDLNRLAHWANRRQSYWSSPFTTE